MHNTEIAHLFERFAVLLDIDGANPFRVRAYRNAARTIESLSQSLESMIADGADLTELPGIGEDLAQKIADIVATGRFHDLDEIEKRVPGALADLTEVPGLGPKRVRSLFKDLGIASLPELSRAAKAGKLQMLPGFGPKIEQAVLQAVDRHISTEKRLMLSTAEGVAAPLIAYLKALPGVSSAVVAGSFRRRRETVGDLDLLVTCRRGTPVMEHFAAYKEIADVLAKGTTRSTVKLRSGLQVDLRVVPEVSYGAALVYFTGSKAHNVAIRMLGVRKGLKINEYGVFKGKQRIAGNTEKEVYAEIDLPFIAPELREDRGEVEAAKAGRLPKLINLDDIRGDLHSHTKATDGHYTIEEMARGAEARGYAYLAISDHTRHVTIAHGLDARALGKQIAEIDRVNAKVKSIRILKSAEVDILADGTLDLPDSILQELDFVVAALHYKFNLDARAQTERLIRAMDNPYVSILAHPTGRLIGEREPCALDMERLMKAALERGCFLEVNAQPERLDLNDIHCRMAKEIGLKVAISTDAHSVDSLDLMRFGIDQARRGWLEADDVINTRSWQDLKRLFQRK
ncbi:MAG: DNA polymerase/3'-5' exonuclease PolX [Parvibaculum sp.]|uniref:DNA polymerase/3'-5' exonuclease PolX n=1 Tax=Parvibaculum sp. TaxID=2024848 RepID=UPI003C728491